MQQQTLIKNATVVNENNIFISDILISNGLISEIATNLDAPTNCEIIDASGKYLFPGIIDDQVHFRQPGLTHKADIYTESKAAVAGGITTFMDMPNTIPNTLSQKLLEEKYKTASETSIANYSFYMGASNNNLEEVLKTNPKNVCGVKVFMGSSTGNMLVDDISVLEQIFSRSKMLIATHCEDETIIQNNLKIYRKKYGECIPIEEHPNIRSREACYKSSSLAVSLAKKYDTRLHVLHISTKEELELFNNEVSLEEKKITVEVCVHHLWFSEEDYAQKKQFIKWNPSIKSKTDKKSLLEAVINNTIDVVATDHAPHTLDEKNNTYFKAPSGGPLIQHSLLCMLEFVGQKKITLEKVVEKMCHHPAILFKIKKRGFIRKGYYADFVLVDMNTTQTVAKENILYKCGWSPLEGTKFNSEVTHTFVNGNLVYNHGKFDETYKGQRLEFDYL